MENKTQGEPSPQLDRMKAAIEANKDDPGSIVESDDEGFEGVFEGVTEAVPERGSFPLVGGYVSGDILYNTVFLRAMGGHEEDLLGNDSVSITQRMDGIMSACTIAMVGETTSGDRHVITDRGQIGEAVRGMPSGSRTHLLICLRRVSHWRRTKDLYEMTMRCPSRRCNKESGYTVDLGSLDLYQPEDPRELVHRLRLEDAGVDITWRTAHGGQDETLTTISKVAENEILSYMILVRLSEWNGEDCRLGSSDVLNANQRKIKLSKRAADLLLKVKNLTTSDREDCRVAFQDQEPGIDTDIEFECKSCRTEFHADLDVGQRTFFFPSATSRRSKQRSST